MKQQIKVILMVFGLSQLFSCGQSDRLSRWLDNKDKLSAQEAAVMQQWLSKNHLKVEDFQVVEKAHGFASDNSVLVIDRSIQGIRAIGVQDLSDLSGLPQLDSLELNHLKQTDLKHCPNQIKTFQTTGN